MESESRQHHGLLWAGLGIAVLGVASYLYTYSHRNQTSSSQLQDQESESKQLDQQQTLQQIQNEKNRFTNWLGIAAMTTGCLLWISSKRRIPFSLLLATGLNLLNSWQAVGSDEENKQSTETDTHADNSSNESQTNEHIKQAETGLQYH